MDWKMELIRALFVAFGTMEVISNIKYLTKENGMERARKQHGEIPKNASDRQVRCKVICMLTSGVMFLTVGLMSYVLHKTFEIADIVVSGAFLLYAIIEALYYRYKNTVGFAAIAMLLFILCL